jgi:hypothetical protein
MERIVITIHPPTTDDAVLRVADAMLQVADVVKLCEDAGRAFAMLGTPFEWQLIRASTNSPFVVEFTAHVFDQTVDVDPFVRRVRSEVASGVTHLIDQGKPPSWMGPDAALSVRSIFDRTQNGIGRTEVGDGNGQRIAIDRPRADAGIRAFERLGEVDVGAGTGEDEAWGEIEGSITSVGHWYNKPALRVWSQQYRTHVWCVLTGPQVALFGDAHKFSEVWQRKVVGVEGRLIYKDERLVRVVATDIREIAPAPPVNLASVRDPDFTGGLDPVEYLRRLHEGELAR